MDTADALDGVRCLDCDGLHDAPASRCPDCDGALAPAYDEAALRDAHDGLSGADGTGLARHAAVLPFDSDQLVTTSEGDTPLVSCPELADELGVRAVSVKDEAQNPTGSIVDRELALAVTAANEQGATDVALPTTGNGGQAAAAYAGRAGLDSHSFVPSRTTFQNKAMINVHGGDMNVVGGRYGDALGAFSDAIADEDWHSLAPFDTPYRHEGAKTVAYELAAGDGVPDAVVCPTGHGTALVGLYQGFRELEATGHVDSIPHLYAAQAAGCAPIATAWEEGATEHDPWEHPDTICGALEIPDPAGGKQVIEALEATDGAAIGTVDDEILADAVDLAQAGVATSATGGAAVSGAKALADQGAFDATDSVVLVNPTTANREADVLRSHLMGQGI